MAKRQKSGELTEMQIAFVYFYCNNKEKNGAESARQAGYSEKTAKQKAASLLKDEKVLTLIHAYEQLKALETSVNPKEEINAKYILNQRIEILENCKKKVPKKVWDYDKHKSVKIGEVMLDPKSAALVLRDIEASLDGDDSKWTDEQITELFEILSK